MPSISREVLIKVIKVGKCASDDRTRPEISGARIKRVSDKYQVAAVNGHCLASTDAGSHIERFCDLLNEGEEISFDGSAFDRILMLLKCYPKYKTYVCTQEESYLKIDVSGDIFTLKLNTRSFPKIETVIPKSTEGYHRVMFNPELLQKVSLALKDSNRPSGLILHLNLDEPLKPIFIQPRIDEENVFGIIMPMAWDDRGRSVSKEKEMSH